MNLSAIKIWASGPSQCPCCGGNSFVKGEVGMFYRAMPKARLTPLWKTPPAEILFRPQTEEVVGEVEAIKATRCTDCGNIQLFSKDPPRPNA